MAFGAPNEIQWSLEASSFLDELVDLDVAYLDVQLAIERVLHAGLLSQVSVPFVYEGQAFYFHRVPSLGPGLRAFDVFTTLDHKGVICVEHVTFAP